MGWSRGIVSTFGAVNESSLLYWGKNFFLRPNVIIIFHDIEAVSSLGNLRHHQKLCDGNKNKQKIACQAVKISWLTACKIRNLL
jgi:hypothetical protein